MAEQVRCLALRRARRRIGRLDGVQLGRLDAALKLHLALD